MFLICQDISFIPDSGKKIFTTEGTEDTEKKGGKTRKRMNRRGYGEKTGQKARCIFPTNLVLFILDAIPLRRSEPPAGLDAA